LPPGHPDARKDLCSDVIEARYEILRGLRMTSSVSDLPRVRRIAVASAKSGG
jgi:hypothetical protein